MPMLDKYENLFQLIRESVFSPGSETSLSLSVDEWNAIFREMCDQAIAALPYVQLTKNPIPDAAFLQKWTEACLIQQGRWVWVMHAQSLLIDLFERNGIPCTIIKGSAAAMAYPYPPLRAVGDVDLLVKRGDHDKAAAILESNGYQLTHDKAASAPHYSYKKDGVVFELHKLVPCVSATNEELAATFDAGVERRVWRKIEDFSFPTLSDDLNALVLLLHINWHLRSGIGLRHMIDWATYLRQNNNLEELLPTMRRVRLEKLALTVTAMCQKYLGLEKIVEETEDLPCDELMEYVMEKGNFGKKSGREGKIESVFLRMANPFFVFQKLQRIGLSRWKAAKKYRILQPFAWVYQGCSIVSELICDGMTPGKMMKMRNVGLEQRDLIRRLGLDLDISFQR